MRVVIQSLLALAAVLPAAAFTNGTLIPAYFCNPVPDGLPKSLGELIPFTKKEQCGPLAFNANGMLTEYLRLICRSWRSLTQHRQIFKSFP
jgi:hypothetical protein